MGQPQPAQHDSARMHAQGEPGEPAFHQPAPVDEGFYQPPPGPDTHLPVPHPTAGSDELRQNVFAAMSSVLVELAQELKRSVDYYRSRSNDAPIHEVLLVGGSAKLRGLAPYLESSMDNVPTRIGDPLQNVKVSSKQFSDQRLVDVAPLFPISIGLGARDLIATPGKAKKR